jgi:hypothetical protein
MNGGWFKHMIVNTVLDIKTQKQQLTIWLKITSLPGWAQA